MGVFIGQSTRIYDRDNDQILHGRVPAGAVVVPGTLPAANGKYGLYCAVIVKRVDARRAPRSASTSCCATSIDAVARIDRWREPTAGPAQVALGSPPSMYSTCSAMFLA